VEDNNLRILDLLVILGLALLWYGLVPVAGAFLRRRSWRNFRKRYDELRLRPYLDYAAAQKSGAGEYRFIGGFESLSGNEGSGDHTLWIKNDDLTIPVALERALTYVLPEHRGNPENFDPGAETPQRIRWNQLVSLTGGARVYVGGKLEALSGRLTFVSRRQRPLLVIFYDGADDSLTTRAIRAGRQRNEYWNVLTPYALALGVFSFFLMILTYFQRPAFQLTVYAALVALGLPLYPMIPPAFLFTVLYRRLWWQARVFRACRDLTRLPLRYVTGKDRPARLPDGELYGGVFYADGEEIRAKIGSGEVPLIIPEKAAGTRRHGWYVFGALRGGPEDSGDLPAVPRAPRDPQATWGAIPGDPDTLARGLTRRAYVLETVSWILLLAGIGLNVFFVTLILRVVIRI
jgi:hypothetical protein